MRSAGVVGDCLKLILLEEKVMLNVLLFLRAVSFSWSTNHASVDVSHSVEQDCSGEEVSVRLEQQVKCWQAHLEGLRQQYHLQRRSFL